MSWRLLIAPRFYRDLIAIEDYLSEQASVKVAREQVDLIRSRIPVIAENPLAYVERLELGPGFRLAVLRPYVVIFRCGDDTVRLLRVVHGARDLPKLLAV